MASAAAADEMDDFTRMNRAADAVLQNRMMMDCGRFFAAFYLQLPLDLERSIREHYRPAKEILPDLNLLFISPSEDDKTRAGFVVRAEFSEKMDAIAVEILEAQPTRSLQLSVFFKKLYEQISAEAKAGLKMEFQPRVELLRCLRSITRIKSSSSPALLVALRDDVDNADVSPGGDFPGSRTSAKRRASSPAQRSQRRRTSGQAGHNDDDFACGANDDAGGYDDYDDAYGEDDAGSYCDSSGASAADSGLAPSFVLLAYVKQALKSVQRDEDRTVDGLWRLLVEDTDYESVVEQLGSSDELHAFLQEQATELEVKSGRVYAAEEYTEDELVADMQSFISARFDVTAGSGIALRAVEKEFLASYPIHTHKLKAYASLFDFFKSHTGTFKLCPRLEIVYLRVLDVAMARWEWQKADGTWRPYAPAVSEKLETAFQAKGPSVMVSITSDKHPLGKEYDVRFDPFNMLQVNRQTLKQRRICRREHPAVPHNLPLPMLPARCPDRAIGSCAICRLVYNEVEGPSAEDNALFAQAHSHFVQLFREPGGMSTPRVLSVEFLHDRRAMSRFLAAQAKLAEGEKPIWVFHGTTKANDIAGGGFEVGGQSVPPANGSLHGRGVYTARGANMPLQYGYGQTVILALALPGRESQTGADDGTCDSWRPQHDWHVFRHGDQLLPVYILHFK